MKTNKKINIAFLSTYPPRECGIATFTQDLINELKKIKIINAPHVIAISDQEYKYDNDVIFELQQNDRDSYIKLADKLNKSNIDLLVIEHEYGIYGGEWGEYILDLIKYLKIPYVVTLHTVLSNPLDKQKYILKELCQRSLRIITMAKNTIPLLNEIYNVDDKKIDVLPHGVPNIPVISKESLKRKYGYDGKYIISTFGLISPGKGLEYAIEAIAKVKNEYPNILYLILGQTHPNIIKLHGEEYRNKLISIINRLNLSDNVKFINKYLTKREIVEYLKLSDIYMTPYLGKEQAVSGTLAYAAGLGKLIISTPYKYAEEVLSDGKGLLAEFRDSDSLAKCIEFVINNPDKKRIMEEKIKIYGETMMWNNVALEYVEMFFRTLEEVNSDERAV
ncbi:glycosyltransferase family 4 protein [Thermoanaerobacterium sp. RBIITD]|uniref:glycosyltransferase family 4 protein n=1 Tax=Thermoanaerobacterium sp. RBIITD TaxID=1550240 RepID=UPI000BB7F350|nr:glycosyltransferase family 4 protein [Thermoanaerobacterium sp. RBIITD]SNX53833.1 Glycosyltransferase involved in cell wall bisynthesis [Thermoanaerobacterium sp. RBIITD]